MTVLVRAASLQGYEDLARSCGVDPWNAMQRVRLSNRQLGDVDSLIPYASFVNLLEQTATESGQFDFGLRLAQVQGLFVFGQLSVLFQHAPTLGHALAAASKYIFVHSPAVQLRVVPVAETPALVELVFALDIPNLKHCAQTIELSLGLIVKGIETVGQGLVRPSMVRIPHAQMGPKSSYYETFSCFVEFDAPIAAVRLEAAAMQQTLPAHNPELQKLAQNYLDTHFGDPSRHFGDRVRSMVERFLSSGMGNQRDISKVLSINARTLQRRLSAEGLHFEDILDDIRKHQLRDLLDQAEAPPLVQIAWILGYTESSTLNRSCRRWYGCTPGELRRRIRADNL